MTPKNYRILLVEDDPLLQMATQYRLQQAGYDVDLAADGHLAVEKVQQTLRGYDVIFMDIQMPTMNGLEATKAIRALEANEQHVPIIALTSEGAALEEECVAAGMDGFLLKPFSTEAFVVLEKIMGK